MATLEELVVRLVAETSGLRAELDKATKATVASTDKMEKAVKDFTENSSKSLNIWESALATLTGLVGADAIKGAFNKLKEVVGFLADEFKKGAEDAIAQEKSLTKLANSLALTGQYSKATIDDLKSFADQMEMLTGVQDDVIEKNLSLLSSLTKLNGEGLKKAQSAALDLATVMDGDLNAATVLTAKGIAGQTSAFTRYGFTVKQGANATENLKNILKALGSTQGAAIGAMQTFDGATIKTKNSMGNLIEAYATAIVKNQAFVSALTEISNQLNIATDSVEGQNQSLKILAGEGLVEVIKALAIASTLADSFSRAVGIPFTIIEQSFRNVASIIKAVVDLITLDFGGAIDEIKNRVTGLGDAFKKQFTGDTGLSKLSVSLLEVGNAAEKGLGALKSNGEASIVPTVKARDAVKELTAAEASRLEQLKTFSAALAEQGAALDGEYTNELISLQSYLDQKLITEEDYYALRAEMLLGQQDAEQKLLEEARSKQALTDQQYLDAKTGLERKQHSDSVKLASDRIKAEEALNKQKTADLKDTLGTIATLQSSNNKGLAAAGKAAAITQATIDGYAAVQKALASAPPPFNFALAALVGAATANNVNKIRSVGLNDGGVIKSGSGANVDSVPASLTKGEAVVDRSTTQKLTRFLDNIGDSFSGPSIEISLKDNLVEFVEARIVQRQRIGISLLKA